MRNVQSDKRTTRVSKTQTKAITTIKTTRSSSRRRKTGQGYRRNTSVSNIPCSRNILGDVSRLEVLIGGKRAGNNSPEIINEAAEICHRLFEGRVIGMGLYRNLVNELIDVDYYSD